MSMPRLSRGPLQHPERVEQTNICNLARSIGGKVCVLGTTRRKGDHQGTMQSPGLPDLFIFMPSPTLPNSHGLIDRATGIWFEVKAPGGKRSAEQIEFGNACMMTETPYGYGTLTDFVHYLVAGGWLKRENVNHEHFDGSRK
jgi:hypothetical protein